MTCCSLEKGMYKIETKVYTTRMSSQQVVIRIMLHADIKVLLVRNYVTLLLLLSEERQNIKQLMDSLLGNKKEGANIS
jgi:hypothetical protein